MLADAEQRDALHCIRCGACLNVCPIFKNVGGFSYGTTYQGPIGSVITPHLRGLQDWKHLSQASSLCGACTEACPVKINLHHHLLHNRRNAASAKPTLSDKLIYGGFAFTMQRPKVLQLVAELARVLQPLRGAINGTILDPLRPWTKTRSFPSMPEKSFRDLWRERSRNPQSSPEISVPPVAEEHSHPHTTAAVSATSAKASSRETILGRIREALKIAAPHPVTNTPQIQASPQQWLPAVGKTLEEQIELFSQNAQGLKADFQVCADINAAIQFIKTVAANDGWKKIGLHRGDLTTPPPTGLA